MHHGHFHRRRGPKITRRPHKSLSLTSLSPFLLCPEIRPATPSPRPARSSPAPILQSRRPFRCPLQTAARARPTCFWRSVRRADRYGAAPDVPDGRLLLVEGGGEGLPRPRFCRGAFGGGRETAREALCGTALGGNGARARARRVPRGGGGGFEARMLAASAAKIALLPSVHGR